MGLLGLMSRRVIGTDEPKPIDECSRTRARSDETLRLECGVEVGRASDVLTIGCAKGPIGRVQLAGFGSQASARFATLIDEVTKPVVFRLIGSDVSRYTSRKRNLEAQFYGLIRTIDHPFHDGLASVLTQVFGVVFYVVFSFNFCLKRNDDQPSPDTGVFCAYLGQVIGIEHQRVAGNETEWILVLLFGKHSVCGSQLLYNAGIEPANK